MSKPKGKELEDWCKAWDEATHEEKMELIAPYGISYETARHWRSDCGIPNKTVVKPMCMTVEDIVGMRPAVNLDFVSFDIETSNLTADFSLVLSGVIKPYGREPIVFRADTYPEWQAGNKSNDKGIVLDIATELAKHAIVITHYGTYFDVPYLRAKMTYHSLPPLPHMFAIDSWAVAYKNFKVSSRKLKNLGKYFAIGEKEEVEGQLWMQAAYDGSTEALDKIVAHNIQDTILLEKLACLSFPFVKSIPRL